jgi:hypothetical protein
MAECADVVLVGDGAAVHSVARELQRIGRTTLVVESPAAVRRCCGAWEVEDGGTIWFVRTVAAPGAEGDPLELLRAVCDDLDRPRLGLG